MTGDPSNGWDAIADAFTAARSPTIGVDVVRRWASGLPPGGAILDIGAGSGFPLTAALIADGFAVSAIEPAPRLAAAFRKRFPSAPIACEPAETSRFFDRPFDGAMAIGLLFLLAPETQGRVIRRAAAALRPGGRFLFSAPKEACTWEDNLTGRRSQSLGADAYGRLIVEAGLVLARTDADAGGAHYYDAHRP